VGFIAAVLGGGAWLLFGRGSRDDSLDKGVEYWQRGQRELAVGEFSRAARENPKSALPHVFLSRMAREVNNLTLAGQEATLAVEYESDSGIEPAFAAAYREIYGYAPEGRAIELESVRVIASSRSSEEAFPEALPDSIEAAPVGHRRCWTEGDWQDIPFFDRTRLQPGASFTGPCLVFEAHSSTVVAEGWRGHVDGAGNLVLKLR